MLKISIITATYNSGKTLCDTIESVLNQTYCDFEHLIIDGGSKDNTLEIIKDYEPKYNGRLRWISEPDRGLYDAMNKGIGMASGDVVGILNSDDFFTSNKILEIPVVMVPMILLKVVPILYTATPVVAKAGTAPIITVSVVL